MHHIRPLIDELRRQHSDANWIWIAQPSVIDELRQACAGLTVTIWTYDAGTFTYSDMKKQLAGRFDAGPVDIAYVPLNHPTGQGYLQILHFIHASRVRAIVLHTEDGTFEPITFRKFVVRRFATRIRNGLQFAWDSLLIFLTVPIITFYYVCLIAAVTIWRKIRSGTDRRDN